MTRIPFKILAPLSVKKSKQLKRDEFAQALKNAGFKELSIKRYNTIKINGEIVKINFNDERIEIPKKLGAEIVAEIIDTGRYVLNLVGEAAADNHLSNLAFEQNELSIQNDINSEEEKAIDRLSLIKTIEYHKKIRNKKIKTVAEQLEIAKIEKYLSSNTFGGKSIGLFKSTKKKSYDTIKKRLKDFYLQLQEMGAVSAAKHLEAYIVYSRTTKCWTYTAPLKVRIRLEKS
jgi:hypothetical protein